MPISASDVERRRARSHGQKASSLVPGAFLPPQILTKLKQRQKWAKKSPLLHSNGRRPFVHMSALTAAETCLLNVPKAFEVWIAANKG